MTKEKLIPNIDLTNYCKKIFGDLVKSAYVDEYYNNSAEFLSHDKTILEPDTLQYDGEQIYIEFINGKVICFSNSEWAYITEVK